MQSIHLLSVSYWLTIFARISFSLVLILAPLRWRSVLWSRPTFPVYPDYTDFLLFASDVALIYMLVFWAGSLLLAPRKVSLGAPSIWIALAGLTLAGFVSTFGGEDSLLSSYQSVRLVILFVFYLYIVNEVTSPLWVLIPVGIQLIFQSLISIPQSLLQHSLGLASLGELRLDPAVAGVSIVPVGELRFLRAYGLTDHPNILGGCLAFGLVLLFAWMLYGHTRIRWLALTAFLPGLLALVMTFSRSAWLGFLIGTSFMVGLELLVGRWDSVKRASAVGVLSLLVLIPFIYSNVQLFRTRMTVGAQQIERFEQQSLNERPFLIRSGNTIFVEHSTTGIGLGASPLAMKSRFPEFPTHYQPPHLTVLTAAMETGVLGAAFYLLLMVLPVTLFLLRWRTYAQQPLMVGAFALLLALMVVGLFDYYPWLNNAGRIWQWLAWGLFSVARSHPSVFPLPVPFSQESSTHPSPIPLHQESSAHPFSNPSSSVYPFPNPPSSAHLFPNPSSSAYSFPHPLSPAHPFPNPSSSAIPRLSVSQSAIPRSSISQSAIIRLSVSKSAIPRLSVSKSAPQSVTHMTDFLNLLLVPVVAAYTLVMVVLLVYIFNYLYLAWLGWGARRSLAKAPARELGVKHRVTVQLPIYNEWYVAERLIESAAALDYPCDLLEIQVLDDSTDDTFSLVQEKVREIRARGINIVHLYRAERTGFKAGALAAGLAISSGEFVAIFDADFLPQPDFLLRTLPHFDHDRIAFVQARWEHLNRDYSLLTYLQSLSLDAHFAIDQAARATSGYFFNFNGTAGIWRKSAIEDAGGWQADTLTEDLDLSCRVFLHGWSARYAGEVEVPAELPVSFTAYRRQQHRWARGGLECAIRYIPIIWRAKLPLSYKLQATLHLTSYGLHFLTLALIVLYPLLLLLAAEYPVLIEPVGIGLFLNVLALVPTIYFVIGQQLLHRRWLLNLPLIFVTSIFSSGMILNTLRAALQILGNHEIPFERTPKYGITHRRQTWDKSRYHVKIDSLVIFEIALAVLNLWTAWMAWSMGHILMMIYAFLFAAGLFFTSGFTLAQSLSARFSLDP